MKLNHLRAYPDGVAVKHNLFHGVNLDTQPALHRFGEPFGMHCAEVSKLAELVPATARCRGKRRCRKDGDPQRDADDLTARNLPAGPAQSALHRESPPSRRYVGDKLKLAPLIGFRDLAARGKPSCRAERQIVTVEPLGGLGRCTPSDRRCPLVRDCVALTRPKRRRPCPSGTRRRRSKSLSAFVHRQHKSVDRQRCNSAFGVALPRCRLSQNRVARAHEMDGDTHMGWPLDVRQRHPVQLQQSIERPAVSRSLRPDGVIEQHGSIPAHPAERSRHQRRSAPRFPS